jgi:hypothetical protein
MRANEVSSTMEPAEQRIHKRFRVRENSYVTLRGPVSKLGQIIDISRGGLSFRYIDIGERPNSSLEVKLSIKKNNGFQLEHIAFKTIYDLRATKEFPFSATRIRRRGGRFVALDPDQISGLEYLIQNYTTGEA